MRIIYTALSFLILLFQSDIVLAVNQSSEAYQMGGLVGKIFLAVFAILIIKKVFFGKK